MNIIEQINHNVKEGRLEDAISILVSVSAKYKFQEVNSNALNISSRLKRLKGKSIINILSLEDENIEMNKITKSILDLVELMKNCDPTLNLKEQLTLNPDRDTLLKFFQIENHLLIEGLSFWGIHSKYSFTEKINYLGNKADFLILEHNLEPTNRGDLAMLITLCDSAPINEKEEYIFNDLYNELNKLSESLSQRISFSHRNLNKFLEDKEDFRGDSNGFWFFPEGVILYGLRKHLKKNTLQKMKEINSERGRVRILTYDTLIEGIERNIYK